MTLGSTIDAHDLTGKIPPAEAHYDVVVVGAGSAGTTAALAAAADGKSVLLVDENPVPPALMGADVPLYYGGRMTAAVQNPGRMTEQVFAANPALEAAFEAGVDVRLGTAAWGLYRNGPAMRTLPEPLLGLADAERAWMVGFNRLVLATGARDVPLAFAGWDRPGVMGAQGFHALLTRYDAFAGRCILILGSSRLALETALLAQAHGIAVAGIVEVLDAVQGPAELAAQIAAAGIAVHLGHVPAALAGVIDGVERAMLRPVHGSGQIAVDCDTVVVALTTAPATELIESGGGYADRVGDCAGAPADLAYVAAWSRAVAMPGDTIVCQCEDVTKADLLDMQPPRYLGHPIPPRPLAGFAHPDQVKRLTRAGMGPCQGRRCRAQVACLLSEATGIPVERIPVASFRAPVRPIPLRILADWQERADMAAGWDVWFGIPTQWTPYDRIGTADEHAPGLGGGNMHV